MDIVRQTLQLHGVKLIVDRNCECLLMGYLIGDIAKLEAASAGAKELTKVGPKKT